MGGSKGLARDVGLLALLSGNAASPFIYTVL